MANGLSSVGVLKGNLSVESTLKGKLQNGSPLKGKLSISSGNEYEVYDGDYIVDPSFELQRLRTKDKLLKEDVEVTPIEVSRVSNLSGGITVFIGGVI